MTLQEQIEIGIDKSNGEDFSALTLRHGSEVFIVPSPFADFLIQKLEYSNKQAEALKVAKEALRWIKDEEIKGSFHGFVVDNTAHKALATIEEMEKDPPISERVSQQLG